MSLYFSKCYGAKWLYYNVYLKEFVMNKLLAVAVLLMPVACGYATSCSSVSDIQQADQIWQQAAFASTSNKALCA